MVQHATKLAKIDKFIEDIPDNYNSYVGERGARLSGGQRQRIGIARALYKKCSLLIFDEATSALDQETEKKIMINLVSKLKGKKTILIVSHNRDLFKFCDNVYELKNKKLNEVKT